MDSGKKSKAVNMGFIQLGVGVCTLASFEGEKQALVGHDLSYHKAGVSTGSQELLLKIAYILFIAL